MPNDLEDRKKNIAISFTPTVSLANQEEEKSRHGLREAGLVQKQTEQSYGRVSNAESTPLKKKKGKNDHSNRSVGERRLEKDAYRIRF